MKNFVTCHCHQQSLDTASTPEAFAAKELELGTGYLTVTDHGTLQASRKVFDLAKKKKLTPIIGLEAYLRDDDCPILTAHSVPKAIRYRNPLDGSVYTEEKYEKLSELDKKLCVPETGFWEYAKYLHLTMHFLDQEAFELGVKILSQADARAERHGSERKPLFTWADLEELGGKNITMTSSCLVGVVQRHLLDHDNVDIATAYYEKLRGICKPGNWYAEVFPHKCDKNWDSAGYLIYTDGTRERLAPWKKLKFKDGEGQLKDYARSWRPGRQEQLLAVMENRKWADREPKLVQGIEVVEDFIKNECKPWAEDGDVQKGTNNAILYLAEKYGDPVLIGDDSHYAKAEEKIVQDIRLQASGGSWRFYGHYHRQSSAEALEHFKGTLGIGESEFEGWVDNSYAWAEKFKAFSFKERKSLPTSFYPKDTLDHTMVLIEKHGRMRWDNPVWVDRLQKEIEMLHSNGKLDLLPYFMIDEEVCDLYGRNGKLTGPGRGSAAGMLLAYLLRITHVDPIKYQLSMERFLTASRIRSGKLPDIDQDLPDCDLLVGVTVDGYDLVLSDGSSRRIAAGTDVLVEGIDEPQYVSLEDAIKNKYRVIEFCGAGGLNYTMLPLSIEAAKAVKVDRDGWLKQRFGQCFAAISTDVSLKLRSAVKDVSRVRHEGRVPDDVEALTRRFQNAPQGISDYDFIFGYKGSDGWVEGSLKSDPALMEYVEKYPSDWDIVRQCLGLTRQKSKHACAYVIADEPVSNFIPLTSVGADEITVTQYTAPYVEAVGGLKMDFLVINSLRDIAAAIKLVQGAAWRPQDMVIDGEKVLAHEIVPFKGEYHSIWKLPEDQAVFRDFCEGKTETVFQFNTPGAVGWLQNFNHVKETRKDGTVVKALDSIEALSAFTALDRPGPLDYFVEAGDGSRHNMLVEFAIRARGGERTGGLPILDQLLPETHGVIVYQEQLQKVYQAVGQTTAEQADEFRVHISKKQMAKVIEDKNVFMPGAIKMLGEETANELWNSMETFGQYGFNKSHSTAYVIISYACAFLKHHFPLEWWTAVLRHADKDEINEKFWRHCGHLIDLPDLKLSGPTFEIINDRIRAPLSLLVGIGEGAHDQITRYAPYTDLEDFCTKIFKHRDASAVIVKKEQKVKTKVPSGEFFKNGNPKFKTEERIEIVDTKKLGRNSLNKSVIATLVISGAMDSFFPPNTPAVDALDLFHATMARVSGKKKPDKTDPKFLSLNPYIKYQMRKSVLPAYSEPIIPMMLRVGAPGLIENANTALRPEYRIGGNRAPFVAYEEIEVLNNRKPWPDDYVLTCAAAGYVMDARKFGYGAGKEAMELTVDIDGGIMKAVKWPGKAGKLPDHLRDASALKGAIIAVLYTKYDEDRPFVIEDVEVVQPPLDHTSAEQSPDPE